MARDATEFEVRSSRGRQDALVVVVALGIALRRQGLRADVEAGRAVDRRVGMDVIARNLLVPIEIALVSAILTDDTPR
jgi:hypothetical protein